MHGNPRNEIQQLGLDRNRGEERGGQQERDAGVGAAAGGAGGAAREEVGEGRRLLSKNSLFLLSPLSAPCLDYKDASGMFLFLTPCPGVSLVLPKNFHSHGLKQGLSEEICTL